MNFSGGGGGGVDAVNLDGVYLPLAGLKILKGAISSNSTSVLGEATPGEARAVYKVPVGKVFELKGFRWDQISASANAEAFRLMYSDNNLGQNSAGALTNSVGVISGVAGGNMIDVVSSANISGGQKAVRSGLMGGSVPEGKYVNITVGQFGIITLYGYERDA